MSLTEKFDNINTKQQRKSEMEIVFFIGTILMI